MRPSELAKVELLKRRRILFSRVEAGLIWLHAKLLNSMLLPVSANIELLFSIYALDLLVACHICWFHKSHISDRAIFFYFCVLRYTNHEVMCISVLTFIKKFVVAGFVFYGAFILARACWIVVLNWSDHFPKRGGAALSAVAHSIDAVLDYWRKPGNIEAIIRLMLTVLTSIALRVERVVTIAITLQAVTKTACSEPKLVNKVIWMRFWARITVMQDHIDEWLHIPALL